MDGKTMRNEQSGVRKSVTGGPSSRFPHRSLLIRHCLGSEIAIEPMAASRMAPSSVDTSLRVMMM